MRKSKWNRLFRSRHNVDLPSTGEFVSIFLHHSPAASRFIRLSAYPKLLWICLVLIVPVVRGQTTIVAALGPYEVVFGADSKRKISEFDPSGGLVGGHSALVC